MRRCACIRRKRRYPGGSASALPRAGLAVRNVGRRKNPAFILRHCAFAGIVFKRSVQLEVYAPLKPHEGSGAENGRARLHGTLQHKAE